MRDYQTNHADEKSQGYSVQISRFLESGRIGCYSPKIDFEMFGPYQTHADRRCLILKDGQYMTLSVPEVKSLWLQIGRALGVNDYRIEYALKCVPEDKRAID